MELSDRLLRVALNGFVPVDDPHIIADAQAELSRLRGALESVCAVLAPGSFTIDQTIRDIHSARDIARSALGKE